MLSQPSSEQLGEAVLNSVYRGTYPDSEEVISAELRPAAFPIVLQFLEKARCDLRDHIRDEIRGVSPEVDEWIAEAKQLQTDIKNSEEEAQEISRGALEEIHQQEKAADTTNKQRLLRHELEYNKTLLEILQNLSDIKCNLDVASQRVDANHFSEAIDLLNDSEAQEIPFKEIHASTAQELLRARITGIRWRILNDIDTLWNAQIIFDVEQRRVTIRGDAQEGTLAGLPALVVALEKLDVLRTKSDSFLHNFDKIILSPLLESWVGNETVTVTINEETIQISAHHEPTTVNTLLDDLERVFRYLNTRLPSSMAVLLSRILIPALTSKLVSSWLSNDVPFTLEGIPRFGENVARVISFRDTIRSLGWKGEGDLTDWIENTPYVWLSKRKETSLDIVRKTLSRGFGELSVVERVEREKVSPNDDLPAMELQDGHTDLTSNNEQRQEADQSHARAGINEEEDVSAWGLDEEILDESQESIQGGAQDAETVNIKDASGAWEGHLKVPNRGEEENTNSEQAPDAQHELILKETYTITAHPASILEVISHILKDAETLASSGPNSAYSSIFPAAAGLLSLPSVILAMYRASSLLHYAKDDAGNMFLYNDSMWLAEQFRSLLQEHSEHANPQIQKSIKTSKLNENGSVLEEFGKQVYKKEMETQRNSLRDILARAHGFVNCAMEPFSTECGNAVNAIVDKIRQLNDHWKNVLSRSALLQSLGSLLSTVTNTMIIDVEDMNDISEVESQQLARLFSRISNLEDLFLSTPPTNSPLPRQHNDVPLTAVYSPNWLRFQFLANILESSLADIRYMWMEGELRLEFSADEIVDLIEALFVDSDHRRRTIGEIRRTSVASN